MPRDDIRGAERAPQELQNYLIRIGSTTPYGEPAYRLVIAENRMTKQGGKWYSWRTGSSIADRGGMKFIESHEEFREAAKAGTVQVDMESKDYITKVTEQPVTCVEEMRWVKKYPALQGWIVEKWFPASCYGSQADWYSHVTEGGLPILGPYPDKGDYEAIAGPLNHLPSKSALLRAVSIYQSVQEAKGKESLNTRILQAVYEAERAEEEREAKAHAHAMSVLKDTAAPYWGNSLAAGRLREKAAKKVGLREHVGA